MPKGVKRSYRSERRAAQAAETRGLITTSARELFLERGYVATTVADIARRAKVSEPTVYLTFHTKRDLLSQVIDAALTGDDAEIPVLARGWVLEVQREHDQHRQVRLIARNARRILARAGPLHRVIREAAATDPEIAALHEKHHRERLIGQTEFVRWLGANGTLTHDTERSGEILWALASPELHDLLTRTLGWSDDAYEHWLAEALEAQLLPCPPGRKASS